MENLPPELLIKIFNYAPRAIINLSQVCKYFHLIATTQINHISLKFERQSEDDILSVSDHLAHFKSIRNCKLSMAYDVNIAEKADFCATHSNKLTHLTLTDFSFLNPFFDQSDEVTYSALETLEILNSDLTSSSEDLPNFILKSCIALKNLKICGCSGFEIEALNEIGRNLSRTKIQKLELHPTYSYFDMALNNVDESWTIDNLHTLSVRSKLVVMKKNFVRNMLGNRRKFPHLRRLELIAELNFGSNFIPSLVQQFPSLEHVAIGKGVVDVQNNDFTLIYTHYKRLRSLEFHFTHQDELELRHRLQENSALECLTIGMTKIIGFEHLQRIAKSAPNLERLNLIVYYLIPSNQEFIKQIIKIFPHIKELGFSHIGQLENIRLFF